MQPIASAIIVTYQSRSTIEATLNALQALLTEGELEVIVVDNTSTDGTPAFIKENFPSVHLIESDRNLGFGNACNLAAKEAASPYLVFINPDAVLKKDALEHLVRFMDERPRVGICAPAILHQHAGGLETPQNIIRKALHLPSDKSRREMTLGAEPFETDWLCGAVYLIRTSLFQELGGFDPRFFMYFEETDLCLRASQAGFEIWAVQSAVAEHEGGVSAKQTKMATQWGAVSKYFFESRYYYLCKHHGRVAASTAETIDLLPVVARAIANKLGLRKDGISTLKSRLAGGYLKQPEES